MLWSTKWAFALSGTHLREGLGPRKCACAHSRLVPAPSSQSRWKTGNQTQNNISDLLQTNVWPVKQFKNPLCSFFSTFSLQVCGSPGVLPCLSPYPSIPADKNTCPTHTSTPNKGQNVPPSLPSSLHPFSLSLFSPLSLSHLCPPHPISSTAPAPGLRKEPFPTLSLSRCFTGWLWSHAACCLL